MNQNRTLTFLSQFYAIWGALEQKIRKQLFCFRKGGEAEDPFRTLSGIPLSTLLKDKFTGLWTNLQRSTQKGHLIFQITSSQRGEGKSTISYLCARTLADSNMGSFLLIDCNIYHPNLVDYFQAPSAPGLLEVLDGDIPFQDAVFKTNMDNLQFLPIGGKIPLIQAQILIAHKIGGLLEEIRDNYDCIIIDNASVVLSTLPESMGAFIDGTILVVKANSTRREVIQSSIAALEQSGITISGIILNERQFNIPDFIYRRMK